MTESLSYYSVRGVVSRVLCKIPPEWASLPPFIRRAGNGKDDPLAARGVGEAGHGPRPAADLPEDALDGVGGPHPAPVPLRGVVEAQKSFPVAQQGRDGVSHEPPPDAHPLPQRTLGGRPAARLIDDAGQG